MSSLESLVLKLVLAAETADIALFRIYQMKGRRIEVLHTGQDVPDRYWIF